MNSLNHQHEETPKRFRIEGLPNGVVVFTEDAPGLESGAMGGDKVDVTAAEYHELKKKLQTHDIAFDTVKKTVTVKPRKQEPSV